MPDAQSPKVKQFHEELQTLCKRYQFNLVPKVSYTENGIVPVLRIVDIVPPKVEPKNKKKGKH